MKYVGLALLLVLAAGLLWDRSEDIQPAPMQAPAQARPPAEVQGPAPAQPRPMTTQVGPSDVEYGLPPAGQDRSGPLVGAEKRHPATTTTGGRSSGREAFLPDRSLEIEDVPPRPLAEDVVPPTRSTCVTIQVRGAKGDAPILLAIFDHPTGFPEREQATRTLELKASDGVSERILTDLPAGTYAIGAFQDLNQDGVLNRGAFGVPCEPYGFSNDARGSFGPPSFEAASFEFGEESRKIDFVLH